MNHEVDHIGLHRPFSKKMAESIAVQEWIRTRTIRTCNDLSAPKRGNYGKKSRNASICAAEFRGVGHICHALPRPGRAGSDASLGGGDFGIRLHRVPMFRRNIGTRKMEPGKNGQSAGKVMMQMIDSKGQLTDTRDMKSRAFEPRLLDLHSAAAYLGVSYWTMRDYVLDGHIPRVILPCSRRRKKGGAVIRRAGDVDNRRVYVDRADLDAFIEKCKMQAKAAQNN
jgi:hypothetical protein